MPKLRDRGKISAPSLQPYEQGEKLSRRWVAAEILRLLQAIEKHGVSDMGKLAEFVRTKTAKQTAAYLQYNEKFASFKTDKLLSTPLPEWMDLMTHAVPEPEFHQRTDEVGVATTLRLAAEEEDQLAAKEGRDSLGNVYRFLMDLANGKIPANPADVDARRILALMHHLAALVRTISLDRHKRWLWNSPILQKVVQAHGHLKPEDIPTFKPDLSLAPAGLRPLIGQLLEPSTNPLQIPTALIINPLTTQLNEQGTTKELELLKDEDLLWTALGITNNGAEEPEEPEQSEGEEEDTPDNLERPLSWPAPAPPKSLSSGPDGSSNASNKRRKLTDLRRIPSKSRHAASTALPAGTSAPAVTNSRETAGRAGGSATSDEPKIPWADLLRPGVSGLGSGKSKRRKSVGPSRFTVFESEEEDSDGAKEFQNSAGSRDLEPGSGAADGGGPSQAGSSRHHLESESEDDPSAQHH